MAPIELDQPNSNIQPLAFLGAQLLTITALTGLIVRFHWRGYTSLPPSQATRQRESRRWKHIRYFGLLAFVSGLVSFYFQVKYLKLSYNVWAHERGEQWPITLWGERGIFAGGEDTNRLQLGRWAHDTFPMVELWDIIFEQSKRAWWSQQLLLGATAWSIFMSIEGRRRKIPYLWAFTILSHLVAQSFAQNLFYLAILVTPVPFEKYTEGSHSSETHLRAGSDSTNSLSRGLRKAESIAEAAGRSALSTIRIRFSVTFASKPASWVPHPAFYIVPLAVNYIAIFLTSFAANTASFATILAVHDAVLFYPLILDRIIPESWGHHYSSSHEAHHAYIRVFRFISVASFVLYGKATMVALLDNTPDSHRHRHSMFFTHIEEHRSKVERGSTAIAKILGAINDHPAVARAGWDVLFCGVSLIIWAAIRGLDVGGMLESSAIMSKARKEAIGKKAEQVVDSVKENALHAKDEVKDKTAYAIDGVKATTRKAVDEVKSSAAQAVNAVNEVKQRTKKLVNSTAEEPTPAPAGKRGRGRPKGSKSAVSTKTGPSRRSTRQSNHETEADIDDSESDDDDFQPDDAEFEGEEDANEDTEAGALAWGLLAIGGLGVGSAGVFGAEATGI